MLKPLLILLVLVVLGGGGFFLYQNLLTKSVSPLTSIIPQATKTTSPTQIISTSSPQLTLTACQILEQGSTDVPPLYKEGVTWQQPMITEYEVSEYEDPSLGAGLSSQSITGCLVKSNVALEFANKTREYYIENLSKLGWKLIDTGDGPSSFFANYKKDKKYLVVKRLNEQLELFYAQ